MQPSVGDPTETEIRLLVRTGAFAGIDPIAVLHDDQADTSDLAADNALF
jgi:hypothetical protein